MNIVRHGFLYVLVFLSFCIETVCAQSNGSVFRTVVLDPGHGGRDPGASGARTKEKDIVLDIAIRLGKMINETYPEVEVVYTRKTDVFVEFHRRTDIANKANANLFISIHANAVDGRCNTVSGTETFVMGQAQTAANLAVAKRENAAMLFEEDYSIRYAGFDPRNPESLIMTEFYQHAYIEQSIDFASEVQNQFKNTANRVDRGVKQAQLFVLSQTVMPSVLVEVGFICNPEEERFMSSEAGKNQLTNAIFRAFSAYKTQIENRSVFRISEHNLTASNSTPSATPATPASATPASTTPASATPATTPANSTVSSPATPSTTPKVEFCIQIYSSSRRVELIPENFLNYGDVERFQISENLFRYVVGRTADYATVRDNLTKVRADYADAFLVSIIDGRIAPLSEGLNLLSE